MPDDTGVLRADAQRNRTRILEAAESVLARDGMAASLREIARQANVGLATIYRHFSVKEALNACAGWSRWPGRWPPAAMPEKMSMNAGVDVEEGMTGLRRAMRDTIEKLLTRAQGAGADPPRGGLPDRRAQPVGRDAVDPRPACHVRRLPRWSALPAVGCFPGPHSQHEAEFLDELLPQRYCRSLDEFGQLWWR
ncbi:helix-turn-helix domain-containing protein [Spirillospora sp. CA-253888]